MPKNGKILQFPVPKIFYPFSEVKVYYDKKDAEMLSFVSSKFGYTKPGEFVNDALAHYATIVANLILEKEIYVLDPENGKLKPLRTSDLEKLIKEIKG